MAPRFEPGESGNPAGRPSNRELVVRELLKQAGLEGIAELARQVQARKGPLVEALLSAAEDNTHQGWGTAQRLLWDLLSATSAKQGKTDKLEVTVEHRKVRVSRKEPRTIDAEEVKPDGND